MIALETLAEETSEYSELRLASRGVHYNSKYDRTTNTGRGKERVQDVHYNCKYDRTTNTGRGDERVHELRLVGRGVHYNSKYDRTTNTGRGKERVE
ncbi:hypothetical protein J6590_036591 [Homalodisca vitripennis]|nr:hypothetical protein J6590_036591 [Homalodisca vitripennis]